MKNNSILITVVVILAIAAIAILLFTNTLHKQQTPTSSTAKSTVGGKTSSVATSIIYATTSVFTTSILSNGSNKITVYSNNRGGPGQSYFSLTQTMTLFGPGGTYSSTGEISGSSLSSFINQYSSRYAGFIRGNATSGWFVRYNESASSNSNPVNVTEVVYSSSQAQNIYDLYLANNPVFASSSSGATFNATQNNMTYSYYMSSTPSKMAIFVGWKHNEVTLVTIFNDTIMKAAVASAMAGDMP